MYEGVATLVLLLVQVPDMSAPAVDAFGLTYLVTLYLLAYSHVTFAFQALMLRCLSRFQMSVFRLLLRFAVRDLAVCIFAFLS